MPCILQILKPHNQDKSVFLFWLLNMAIRCEHVHRLEFRKSFKFCVDVATQQMCLKPHFLFWTYLSEIKFRPCFLKQLLGMTSIFVFKSVIVKTAVSYTLLPGFWIYMDRPIQRYHLAVSPLPCYSVTSIKVMFHSSRPVSPYLTCHHRTSRAAALHVILDM